MSKQMASQWDPLLVLCSPMLLCAPLKINSIKMTNCPPIIDDMWMTPLPSCLTASAGIFLDTLNHCHPSAKFTMEVERNASLPFIGVKLFNLYVAPRIKTKVYAKPTSTGLLLHHQSHVDIRYKRSLITTMLDHVYRISSDWSYFSQECDQLETVFLKLKYPKHLFNVAVKQFVDSKAAD